MSGGSFLLFCLGSYLLGTVSFSYLLVRRLKGIDLRTRGSGNLGATNAGRVLGKRWGLAIYLLDFLKGLAAAGLPLLLFADPSWNGVPLPIAAGTLVVQAPGVHSHELGERLAVFVPAAALFAFDPATGDLLANPDWSTVGDG